MAMKARIIQKAMERAADKAMKDGITDPNQIRAAMMAARKRILDNWFGEQESAE
jgi:hypothetical protein